MIRSIMRVCWCDECLITSVCCCRWWRDIFITAVLIGGITMKTLRRTHKGTLWLDEWKKEMKTGRREGGRGSAHLEHDPVLFLRLLNHTHVAPHCDFWHGAGLCNCPTWPVLTLALFIKVFVCGSGRAPPSSAGLWYITLLLLRVTRSTSLPGTDTQLNWVCHCSPLLVHSSCVVIQSTFKCGDGFRAARPCVRFRLHRRQKWCLFKFMCSLQVIQLHCYLASGEKLFLRVLLVCVYAIKYCRLSSCFRQINAWPVTCEKPS